MASDPTPGLDGSRGDNRIASKEVTSMERHRILHPRCRVGGLHILCDQLDHNAAIHGVLEVTMICRSEQINELAAALAKAQGEMGHATRSSVNPHYRTTYADLSEVINAIREPFSRNGLSYSQHVSYSDGIVSVDTILMHSSGQWESSRISSPVAKADAQGIGSATTYCRRYSLAAIAGIAQADDDGNAASGRYGGNIGTAEETATAPVDPNIAKKFEDARTIDELKDVWSSIPVGARHAYKEMKDAAKKRLSGDE